MMTPHKNIMVAHTKSPELHVPLKVKVSKRVPWENDRTIEKRIILNEVYKRKQAKPTQANNEQLKAA